MCNVEEMFCCGAILIKDGKYLFGRRSASKKSYPGLWDLPGGHAELHEVKEQTLKRELMEELGIIPTDFELLYETEVSDSNSFSFYKLYIYLVTGWAGTVQNLGDEHSEICWFSLDEIFTLECASDKYHALIAGTLL